MNFAIFSLALLLLRSTTPNTTGTPTATVVVAVVELVVGTSFFLTLELLIDEKQRFLITRCDSRNRKEPLAVGVVFFSDCDFRTRGTTDLCDLCTALADDAAHEICGD